MNRALGASSLLLLCLAAGPALAQVSLTGPAYTQDFDTLSNTAGSTTNNLALPGWLMAESGGGARDNEQYAVDTGGSNTGDTYSYGSSGATDRALGGLQSGTLIPVFGACFSNDTGSEITALDVAYTGEQWRLGTAGRADRLDFQYSLDATSLATGTWVDVDALDFSTPNTATTGGKDGNDGANRTAIASQIAGLAVADGAGFCVRWTDLNASGADDGLAVDDFSLTPVLAAAAPDITLAMTAAPNPVAAGGTLVIRSRIANEGPVANGSFGYVQQGPATLPISNATFENLVGLPTVGCSWSSVVGSPVSCNAGAFLPGEELTLRVDYGIPADAVGPLVFTGTMTGPAGDANPDDNNGRLVVTVAGQEADLGVVLTDDADPVVPGGTVTYHATVFNQGPGSALGATLRIPLPANTTYVDSSFSPQLFDSCAVVADALECTGSVLIPPAFSAGVSLELVVDGGFIGTLDLTATVGSEVVDLVPGNNSEDESTQVQLPLVAIHDVQGNGAMSPIAGSLVAVEGIVTALRSNGFYLQTADAEVDADPATSQGVLVFTGSAPPAAAAVGNRVQVAGTVTEFRSSSNPHQGYLTEITSPTVSLVGTGEPLPAPVEITAALADPDGPVDALERLEGMRVSVASLTAVGPGEGFIDEDQATSVANGLFWAVVNGVPRPFREEGVGVMDEVPGLPAGTPRFDTNPERIRVDSDGLVGAPVIAVDAGATVEGLVGVLDYGFGTYTLMPDPDAVVTVTGGAVPSAVSDPTASEITIAGFNLLRFYDDNNDPGGDVALTTLAFERRLAKTAGVICEYVKTPDILGVVEVENLNALSRLADAINNNVPGTCTRNPQYVAYLQPGNDSSNINIGFLVSTAEVAAGVPRVEVVDVVQYGKDATITNPNSSTSIMNDRPPLVLRAVVNSGNGASLPLTVIGNHLLALSDINSLEPGSNGYATTGDRRRTKRAEQAVFTANLIEQFQQDDPDGRIVLLGDFNAFEFNDGYVDVMGIITGREAANDEVLVHRDSPISIPLTNMTTVTPAEDRYSYSFEGNAQVLDHLVVNQALIDSGADLRTEHPRINADFGVDNFGDDGVPLRTSDHDPVVLYIGDASFRSVDLGASVAAGQPTAIAGDSVDYTVTVSNTGPEAAVDVLVTLRADAELPGFVVTPPAGFACGAAVVAAGSTSVECAIAELSVGSVQFDVTASTLFDTVFTAGELTLTATVETISTDANGVNDTGSAAIAFSPPEADLAVYGVEVPPGIVYAREATIGFQVRNRGPNAAPGTWINLAVAGNPNQVIPVPPAGWSCSQVGNSPARKDYRCNYAGAYADGARDVVRFRVLAAKSTTVSVIATTGSLAIDEVGNNNEARATFRVGLGSY